MRLSEFADVKRYKLSTDDMAAVVKQIKRIWRNYGVDADAPLILRIIDEPEDKKSTLINVSAK